MLTCSEILDVLMRKREMEVRGFLLNSCGEKKHRLIFIQNRIETCQSILSISGIFKLKKKSKKKSSALKSHN